MFLTVATCCLSGLWQSKKKEEQKLGNFEKKPMDVSSVDRHGISKNT